eukprot:IDg101t1
MTEQEKPVRVRHLIIQGSSQWVIGRNVTKHCNIIHINGNKLQLPVKDDQDENLTIELADHDMHCFVPLFTFGVCANSAEMYCATVSFASKATNRSWPELKSIIDKVHKHVCGHASYNDIRILLERNDLWNEDVRKYLQSSIDLCPCCKVCEKPKAARQVSLYDIDGEFNDRVCMDHMFLDDLIVLHIMDSKTRFSCGSSVKSKSIEDAIECFELLWVSQFGYSKIY